MDTMASLWCSAFAALLAMFAQPCGAIKVEWAKDPSCSIAESMNVSQIYFKGGWPMKPVLCISASMIKEVSNGTAQVTVDYYSPLVYKTYSFGLCGGSGQPACPLKAGSQQDVCLGGIPWIIPQQLSAGVMVTGYTPDFRGLQLLTCTFTLSWKVPGEWKATSEEALVIV
mmetsp:Transcript_149072/g.285663  ORF Transcript_149072/g.285663 Transcript_149072/m.285663 type:complete len:170 (-) Transcript_149072:122-631(-)